MNQSKELRPLLGGHLEIRWTVHVLNTQRVAYPGKNSLILCITILFVSSSSQVMLRPL
jgi:hypothetical protein